MKPRFIITTHWRKDNLFNGIVSRRNARKHSKCRLLRVQRLLLVEFLARCATDSSERYVATLQKLKQRVLSARPNSKMNQVLLLHDNARPHTNLRTRDAFPTMACLFSLTFPTVPIYHPPTSNFGPPKGRTPRTPCCWRRRADTQRAWGAATLRWRVFSDRHTAYEANVGKGFWWLWGLCGKIISTL